MKKPIKNFEDLYEVSDKGEIFSLPRIKVTPTCSYITKENKSMGYKNKKGYMVFDLIGKNKRKNALVHRLVAEAFIPNPENKPQINHKDGNKANNCVENLEWVTNSENQKHAFAHNLQKGNFEHHNSKLNYEDVVYIKNNYQKGILGYGIRSLAKKFNVCDRTIKQILDGKSYKNVK